MPSSDAPDGAKPAPDSDRQGAEPMRVRGCTDPLWLIALFVPVVLIFIVGVVVRNSYGMLDPFIDPDRFPYRKTTIASPNAGSESREERLAFALGVFLFLVSAPLSFLMVVLMRYLLWLPLVVSVAGIVIGLGITVLVCLLWPPLFVLWLPAAAIVTAPLIVAGCRLQQGLVVMAMVAEASGALLSTSIFTYVCMPLLAVGATVFFCCAMYGLAVLIPFQTVQVVVYACCAVAVWGWALASVRNFVRVSVAYCVGIWYTSALEQSGRRLRGGMDSVAVGCSHFGSAVVGALLPWWVGDVARGCGGVSALSAEGDAVGVTGLLASASRLAIANLGVKGGSYVRAAVTAAQLRERVGFSVVGYEYHLFVITNLCWMVGGGLLMGVAMLMHIPLYGFGEADLVYHFEFVIGLLCSLFVMRVFICWGVGGAVDAVYLCYLEDAEMRGMRGQPMLSSLRLFTVFTRHPSCPPGVVYKAAVSSSGVGGVREDPFDSVAAAGGGGGGALYNSMSQPPPVYTA